jgi:ribonuclease R
VKASAAQTVVAVLQRRGRFWTAEPLFAPRDRADGRVSDPPSPPRRGGRGFDPRQMTLGSSLAGDAGREAGPGDLVLLSATTRGGSGGGGRSGRSARGAGGERIGVARVIGRPDVARDVIEGLMLDRGLARGFDAAVEREARASAGRGFGGPARPAGPGGPGGRDRVDLRGLATFTIDPPSARDFDDAVSAQRIEGSDPAHLRVWVHIADVSAHVPEGSLVDREARARGTSVYVPGAVEPMLPQALSGDACSLVPGRDRAAVTVELQLRDGQVSQTAFYRSTIRSDERLDYDRVDRIFAGREAAAAPWGEPLAAAREAARALARVRERRGGALTLDTSEPEFRFDEHGHVSEIARRAQTESHRLIEHLMIAANEAVARALAQRGTPCLYRVHERPEATGVERLVEQLVTLGVPTPPVPERMSATQAAELMGEISRLVEEHIRRTAAQARSGGAKALGAPSGGRPALTSLVLRALRAAYYSPRNIGHAGLGSECYCHFTSPIRRYPDLVCHRALLSSIGADERAPRGGGLGELGEWTSQRERAAMEIERDADDVACCFALEQMLYEGGWEQVLAGEVVGLISAGAFVAFGQRPLATASAPLATASTPLGTVCAPSGTDAPAAPRVPPYEGMLPVRRLARAAAREREQAPTARGGARGGRRAGPRDRGAGERREWWELNEQGTILRGEHTGATLRLGDPIEVRVRGVDAPRGRVDLAPAQGEAPDERRTRGSGGRLGS